MLIPKILLTKDDILSKVSEEDIFRRYSEFKEVGKFFKSPFGRDKTPSCVVDPLNNYLVFKDFSSGKSGNCFQLLMQLEGIDYQEALRLIKADFNIKRDFNYSLINDKRIYIPKNTQIKIKSIDWTQDLLDYWLGYGISLETLLKFKIKPISHYWVNNNRFSVDFGFAYCFPNNKFKILQPDNGLWKWISNTNSDTIQGLEQLDYPKDIIITSSLKDVACIHDQLQIQSIAPNSENTMLPEWVINKLKLLNTTVWFNNDEVGIREAEKYKKYGFNIFIHSNELGKDPSDCFKNGYDLKTIYKQ